jgi:hypothetical protein
MRSIKQLEFDLKKVTNNTSFGFKITRKRLAQAAAIGITGAGTLFLANKIYNKEVWIKMNNEQLLSSRGKPTNIEKEQTIESTTETWIYGNKNTGNYFVLVDNIVTRIVDR